MANTTRVYRFRQGERHADLEISQTDSAALITAMAARGFDLVEIDPAAAVPRLSAEEVAALFAPAVTGEVRGPDAGGRMAPVGVVAGDIRIRGATAIAF